MFGGTGFQDGEQRQVLLQEMKGERYPSSYPILLNSPPISNPNRGLERYKFVWIHFS